MVAGESDMELWNLDWLKDELKIGFLQGEICTDKVRDGITPVIDIDEVAVFDTF